MTTSLSRAAASQPGIPARHHNSSLHSLLHYSPAQRSFHSTPHRASKPKIAVAAKPPAGWRWSSDQKSNTSTYNVEFKRYRESLAILRNAWQPYVQAHNDKVAALKAARDKVRLQRQDAELEMQFKRWRVPSSLRTSQQIRSNPRLRSSGYARHTLALTLANASRAAQVQQLLNESTAWVAPTEVDAAINHALDNPVNIYAEGTIWSEDDLEDVPEYVSGFEGPGVEVRAPDFSSTRSKASRRQWPAK